MKDIDWKEVERRTDNLMQRSEMTSALAAAIGFFCGGGVATVTLHLVGYPIDSRSGQQAVTIISIVCGVVGYLIYRAKEKKRSEIWWRVLQDMEEDLAQRKRFSELNN